MHKTQLTIVAVLAVLSLIAIVALVDSNYSGVTAAPAPVLPPGETTAVPQASPAPGNDDSIQGDLNTAQTGTPAIHPSVSNAEPGTPAFTEADVKAFASKNKNGFGTIRFASSTPAISRVQFGMGSVVKGQFTKLDLPISNNELVCSVVYDGDFVVQGPAGIKPVHYTNVVQVFDAHTGNLLVQTAYNRK